MMKNGLLVLLLLLASCANQPQTSQATKENKKKELLGDFGSAKETDRDKRLEFLTGALKEKSLQVNKLKQKNLNSETAALELEILTNEMLLLEAEKYGLEDGLELDCVNLE